MDESVWFDALYLPVVCPIFYAETLSDLSKEMKGGKSAAEEVEKIANKFPDMGGTPCLGHMDLCIGNLLGHPVSMDGRIMTPGGYPVKDRGKTGYVFDSFPEVEAFNRWQQGEFQFVEDNLARFWRASVSNLDLNKQAEVFRSAGIDNKVCKSLDDVKAIASEIVKASKPFDQMALLVHFLNIPHEYQQKILKRWSLMNYPPLARFAPYAAFVLEVELFFQIAVASKLIASERPSNRVDISYLFYLPFCMIFVSSDKLHRRCASHFLRGDQEFVWGQDLKADLARINERHLALPEATKQIGVLSFANSPPKEAGFMTTELWDRHMSPRWRDRQEIRHEMPKSSPNLVATMKKVGDAPPAKPEEVDMNDIQSMVLKRMVRKKKGSWFQIHKDIKNDER
ncbi:MAG: hypothetical protein HWD57_17040 [Candidatus Accumulibacter cognatus]|uniref:Uncharacterized protein n=1 Tax=Candidatus Accumulibacter cognatus TaxID=2954383 RepID=A0A7D5SG10_9PROT|nr:MAG: hypothetical protein HWD57_17040 [Candidatus Accumulibacter cognatus]